MLKQKKTFFFLLILICLILFSIVFSTSLENEISEVDIPPADKVDIVEDEQISTNIVYQSDDSSQSEGLIEKTPPLNLDYDYNGVDFFSYISELEKKGCIVVYASTDTWKRIKVKGGIDVVDLSSNVIESDKWTTYPYKFDNDYMFRKYIAAEDKNKRIFLLKPIAMEKYIQDVIIEKLPSLGIDLNNTIAMKGKYFMKNHQLYVKLCSITSKNSLVSNMNISIKLP